MSHLQSRIAQARRLAAQLKAEGRTKDAQIITDLCHSATHVRVTASSIHRELEDTRRACGMPTWER